MKIIDHKLFIEFAEIEACDVPRRTILSWDNIKDPTDKRKVLIDYDDLHSKYQEKIIKRFGDPYTYVHKQAIKEHLKIDVRANDFFTSYRTNNDNALPKEKIQEYITCANWLNLIIDLTSTDSGKKFLKQKNLSGSKFWDFICSEVIYEHSKDKSGKTIIKKNEFDERIVVSEKKGLLEIENIALPYDYQSLLRKVKKYQAEEYKCIVSKKFENTNSKKVKGELNTALLLEMLSHGAQYDDTFISIKYNKFAEVSGCKPITPVTVGNYRKEHRVFIDGSRKGNKVWYDYAGKSTPQFRPTAPLLLINSDDNELDLYFQEIKVGKNGKNSRNYYYRPVLYVVIDAFNDYVLGYAIGDSATKNLIKAAYLDAANHVKQLTGDRYFWHEIKTDRWGIDREAKNDFSQWFSNQAKFTPTLLGNSRGKVIEQSFGTNWGSKLKELFPANYSGNNITAKSTLNKDWIELNKKTFPSVEEAAAHVEQFINEMRLLHDKASGKTRQQQWLDAFDTMQDNKKRIITDEQHLMLLGYDHINRHTRKIEANTITKSGLTPVINDREYIFEIPQEQYLSTLGLRVNLKYDPYDMSKVLAVSKDEKTRMMCHNFERMPMAFADWDENTPARLNSLMAEKGGYAKQIRESKEERQAILSRNRMNAEAVLGAGVLVKEVKHEATRALEGNYVEYAEVTESRKPRSIRDLM